MTSHIASRPEVTLVFNDLNYSVIETAGLIFHRSKSKEMKTILKDVSGVFKPGQLTAIMGPSGAGKSSLMNILAGYKTKDISGTISVNGSPRDLSRFRKISCYIMQDDLLVPNLTVLETMRFAAQLKLPRKFGPEQKQLIVTDIIQSMGLYECSNVRNTNLSGGQRKRLAIAQELINNPPIMFFDEPTSGLDSSTCYSVVKLLKSLAVQGRTIICTIHQPSARILEQFDSLYLLSAGQNLYRGPIQDLVQFFTKQGLECPEYHNPADYAIEVASGDFGAKSIEVLAQVTQKTPLDYTPFDVGGSRRSKGSKKWTDGIQGRFLKRHFSTSSSKSVSENEEEKDISLIQPLNGNGNGNGLIDPEASKSVLDDNEDGRIGRFYNQFITLYKRTFICISRDTMLTKLRLGSTILVGLLIGAIYHNVGNDASRCFHNAGGLQFNEIFLVLSAMMTTVLTFPIDLGVLIREHLNYWYTLKTYFLARVCADFPFQLFYPILYTLMTHYMTEQPFDTFRVLLLCLLATLLSMIAQTVGLLIGATCSISTAIYIGPISVIPLFLLAGFFVNISTVPAYIRWVSWISYPRYAFQSSLTAIYGYDRAPLDCKDEYCHFKYPYKFLEVLDCLDVPVQSNIIISIVMLFVFWVLSYWALRYQVRSARN